MLPREIVCSGGVKSTDNIYKIPLSPEYVMKKVPSWKFIYSPDALDCDDFVRIFRGWLSKKGWGNLLCMDAEVILENGIPHNLIAFIDLERLDKQGKHPLIFGEPQTGEIVFENYTNIKLRA